MVSTYWTDIDKELFEQCKDSNINTLAVYVTRHVEKMSVTNLII